mmetsp:Transcript_86315/g.241396  ORF Transcript_86315/g.241396 Transcript_86315/m.241396 type:complete len:115 (-) Transcript_86315:851-1195(-)
MSSTTEWTGRRIAMAAQTTVWAERATTAMDAVTMKTARNAQTRARRGGQYLPAFGLGVPGLLKLPCTVKRDAIGGLPNDEPWIESDLDVGLLLWSLPAAVLGSLLRSLQQLGGR